MNLKNEVVKNLFKYSSYKRVSLEDFDNYYYDSLDAIEKLKNIFDSKKSFFDIVKKIFYKKLNISKNLKLEDLKTIQSDFIVYTGKYKNNTWEEVHVELEIRDNGRLVSNIVFLETGEIRQWHWKPEL